MISPEQIIMIKNYMPTNHLQLLYEKLNKKWSVSMIGKVLRGKRSNNEILEAAIELAHQEQCKKIALQERINKLT